ncbi:MAG: PilW family protein [Pseudomonadales bacterium]|nr:PilW family protein [Pseudomonadales bacterium]
MKDTVNRSRINKSRFAVQSGLGLIELMIAMVVGLTLTAGVMQVYVANNQTERVQEARARMQENGRFAINFLAREIRMAGFLGCLSSIDPNRINNTLNGAPATFQPDKGVQGWEAMHGNGTAPGAIANSQNNLAPVNTDGGGWISSDGSVLDSTMALPASDIIKVWNSSGGGATINAVSGGAMTVVNSTITDLADGDILLLSDCSSADWVQACNVQTISGGASINSVLSAGCVPGNDVTKPLGTQSGGELVKLQGTSFYIGKRANNAANPPALFRRRLSPTATSGAAEELIEGIESLQVLYGVNLDNDNQKTVDAYVPANQVTEWGLVVSVRISLLVQSIEDALLPTPQAYSFNGVTYDGSAGNGSLPADRRLRQTFTSTITLRNRAVGR